MSTGKGKLLILLIALLAIGIGVWYFVFFLSKDKASNSPNDLQDTTAVEYPQEETEADSKFASLYGDDFDEAYIADMLAHHDGAVNMAERAQAVTAHEEIRTLAMDITMTQSQEIMEMRTWQEEWGYEATMSSGHMNHSGAGREMGGDMVDMINKLQNLEGEAYDKEFLKQMILHHEQAVEMSQYAKNNAKHQEIKDLAEGVITVQTKEIEQMRQWQKEWGYEGNY